MTEIHLKGKIVSRSRNLRGVLEYARKHSVAGVHIYKAQFGGGLLNVTYGNGATSTNAFASFTVLQAWVKARRSWPQSIATN